jgi:hypothetical protein
MIALNAALRRLTVCQLTRESRGNGGGLRPRVWLRLRAAAWGQLDPGWNLTIGRRSQFLLVLEHEAHPKTTLYGVVFQKIEWAPAYGPPVPGLLANRPREAFQRKTGTNYRPRSAEDRGRSQPPGFLSSGLSKTKKSMPSRSKARGQLKSINSFREVRSMTGILTRLITSSL